jgi:hypothetical protein
MMLLRVSLLGLLAPTAAAACNVTTGVAYPDSRSTGASVLGNFAGDAAACCAHCSSLASCAAFTWRENGGASKDCIVHPTGAPLGAPVMKGAKFASGVVRPQDIPAPLPPPPPQPDKPAPKGAKNVLFLISDDLRPEMLEAYGQKQMITPSFDKLAKESLVLNRAYCQQAICGPTRNSFLSGRRPQRTQAWNFKGMSTRVRSAATTTAPRLDLANPFATTAPRLSPAIPCRASVDHFREPKGGTTGNEPARTEDGRLWVSLPGYFKTNGYITMGGGKTYAFVRVSHLPTPCQLGTVREGGPSYQVPSRAAAEQRRQPIVVAGGSGVRQQS